MIIRYRYIQDQNHNFGQTASSSRRQKQDALLYLCRVSPGLDTHVSIQIQDRSSKASKICGGLGWGGERGTHAFVEPGVGFVVVALRVALSLQPTSDDHVLRYMIGSSDHQLHVHTGIELRCVTSRESFGVSPSTSDVSFKRPFFWEREKSGSDSECGRGASVTSEFASRSPKIAISDSYLSSFQCVNAVTCSTRGTDSHSPQASRTSHKRNLPPSTEAALLTQLIQVTLHNFRRP